MLEAVFLGGRETLVLGDGDPVKLPTLCEFDEETEGDQLMEGVAVHRSHWQYGDVHRQMQS